MLKELARGTGGVDATGVGGTDVMGPGDAEDAGAGGEWRYPFIGYTRSGGVGC
jgi:hypothetical protein